jgi:iron complex outermembrane recepter protein
MTHVLQIRSDQRTRWLKRLAYAPAVSAIALVAGGIPATAQTAPQTSQSAVQEEIVVTGSRIARDGFEAPTPVTVISADELEAVPRTNIAEFVNELPALAASNTPTPSISSSAGTNGINSLNLRGLGVTRTLTLFDGQRNPVSTIVGDVDINTIPQTLISRVEIVTGGASAAYGSDALSGVVNFILDKEYTGLKGEVAGSITNYGDDPQWQLKLTTGVPFSAGRGHFLMAGEASIREGIDGTPRDWNRKGCYRINNPAHAATNGQPEQLITCGASLSNATAGGIIISGPLKGIAFGPGGTPYNFEYGTVRDPWMIGGDWEVNQFTDRITLDTYEARQSIFARTEYDISDRVTAFVTLTWNDTKARSVGGYQFNQGNVGIRTDNAFLPLEIRQRATTLGLTVLNMGTMNRELTSRPTMQRRIVNRYTIGAEGTFDLGAETWSWDAYVQKGVTRTNENLYGVQNNARMTVAQDAVFGANGQIVCRINADAVTTNDDPACVPLNRMGRFVVNEAAADYVLGDLHRNQRFAQDVGAFSVSGDAFENWAGAVSLAAGIEHRQEKVSGLVPPEHQAGWLFGNFLATTGKYTVTEGFLETVFPLANDVAFARSLELNAAARATDYSTSGFVLTWKAGMTWAPVDDLRFRLTRSRDIRAPNLSEYFAAGTSNTNNVIDPFNNNTSSQYTGFLTGNPGLEPEKADTLGLGVVFQPSFFPGFSTSVDYYNIDIKDAIGSLSAQQIVDRCFTGQTVLCSSITRTQVAGANVISRIAIQPFNFVNETARGVDIEASYRFPVSSILTDADGDLTVRFLGTKFLKDLRNDGTTITNDVGGMGGGSGGTPRFRWRGSVGYGTDVLDVTLIARGVSSGVYDTSNIECQTGCPVSTPTARTINNNRIDGAVYLDTTISYKFDVGESLGFQAYLNVKNITNADPKLVAPGPGGSAYGTPPTNSSYFDALGRVWRAGLRFQM